MREERPAPVARFQRLTAASILALLFAHTPLPAQDLSAAVKVGSRFIAPNTLSSAISDCEQHASHLDPVSCLQNYFVPRWLMDEEAERLGLLKSPALSHVRADTLSTRLTETIAQSVPAPSAAEVDVYLKKHQRDFEKPLRIRIFRILVDKEEEARSILQKVTPTTTLTDFRAWARDHSIDRATNQRAGDLGFVWPDGSTDIPQVSAETTLYEAALSLADGEISKEPVVEDARYAVIWRRGTLPAIPLSEESRKTAELRLREKQTEAEIQKVLKSASSEVRGRDDQLLGKLRREGTTLFQAPGEKH